MKKEPETQGQHKVSQVYLKQFGYQKNGQHWLSIYRAGNKTTENILISEFTREINIFDLPYSTPETKRLFENNSNLIENHYRTIISNLHNQKRLTPRDSNIVDHFVANILCRTNPFRSFIDNLLRFPKTRDKIIEEMTMFTSQKEHIKTHLSQIKIEHQLNPTMLALMDHLIFVFSKFHKVIIRENDGNGWLTTDSPVHLDKQNFQDWVIPLESEIYLPLSKDFCLFMFHPESEKSDNPLRQLKPNRIHSVDFEIF
jgi:hypothetical protein